MEKMEKMVSDSTERLLSNILLNIADLISKNGRAVIVRVKDSYEFSENSDGKLLLNMHEYSLVKSHLNKDESVMIEDNLKEFAHSFIVTLNTGVDSDNLKPNTYYLVEVSHNKNNVPHMSIFFSGFLDNGIPSGYNSVFNPTYDRNYKFQDLHSIKYIKELYTENKE